MTKPDNPDQTEASDLRAADTDADHTPDVSASVNVAVTAGEQTGSADAPDDSPERSTPEAPQQEAPEAPQEASSATNGGPAYGYSLSSFQAPQAAPRYGRPVAQPFNTQPSRGPSQNYSQPTVRIGGRVQSEQASPQPPPSTRVRPTRIPRRTSLQLRYLEPWSVLKVSLVLSVAGFLAWMVAVGVLYSVLAGMGVWDQLNGTYSDLTSVNETQASEELISAGGVFGVAALVGLVNIVLITAMCSVGAFIYNASADLAGGIEITLSERD